MDFSFVKYDPKYDPALYQLEQDTVQGKGIRLQILKKHFLDRAKVFKKYYPLMAVDNNDKPIASGIGAATKLIINGTPVNAGIAYDVKVSLAYRNKGIAKKLAHVMYKQFFYPEGLDKNFVTLKQSNNPVIHLLPKAVANIYIYDFVYLTIPCDTENLKLTAAKGDKPLFSVSMFLDDEPDPSLYTITKSGLGIFKTFSVYQLQIKSIIALYKLGLWLLKYIKPSKYSLLPREGENIRFGILFNHSPENIIHIQEVLKDLQQNGINYLLVCCRKNDIIYNTLKDISINTYGYYMISDFQLSNKDAVTIDVRCL